MISISHLVVPQIKMVHIHHGDNISVLMGIDCEANLVKEQLGVNLWRLFIELVIEDDLKQKVIETFGTSINRNKPSLRLTRVSIGTDVLRDDQIAKSDKGMSRGFRTKSRKPCTNASKCSIRSVRDSPCRLSASVSKYIARESSLAN